MKGPLEGYLVLLGIIRELCVFLYNADLHGSTVLLPAIFNKVVFDWHLPFLHQEGQAV